jgi:hypothetical protein
MRSYDVRTEELRTRSSVCLEMSRQSAASSNSKMVMNWKGHGRKRSRSNQGTILVSLIKTTKNKTLRKELLQQIVPHRRQQRTNLLLVLSFNTTLTAYKMTRPITLLLLRCILCSGNVFTEPLPSNVLCLRLEVDWNQVPNELIASLTEPPIQRRLRRYWPHDLLVRF